jgi:hypothetical protein
LRPERSAHRRCRLTDQASRRWRVATPAIRMPQATRRHSWRSPSRIGRAGGRGPRRAGPGTAHVALDRAFAGRDAELERLAPDALGAPETVVPGHPSDQRDRLRREATPTGREATPAQ